MSTDPLSFINALRNFSYQKAHSELLSSLLFSFSTGMLRNVYLKQKKTSTADDKEICCRFAVKLPPVARKKRHFLWKWISAVKGLKERKKHCINVIASWVECIFNVVSLAFLLSSFPPVHIIINFHPFVTWFSFSAPICYRSVCSHKSLSLDSRKLLQAYCCSCPHVTFN